MSTPTPRTDAAWASSFEECEYRAAHTARTMRECSQQLETELTTLTAERDHWQKIAVSASHEREHNANVAQAMTAERDQLRVDLELADVMYQRECEVEHELRTEVERLRADRTYNHECINRLASATGTLGEKSEKVVDVVLSTIDQLRAENVTLRGAQKACEAFDEPTAFEVRQLRARAARAEDNLAALEQCHDDNCRQLVRIADDLAKERARLRQLALDACRAAAIVPLVWYPAGHYINPNDLGKINKQQVDACVAAIDAAMKEDAK